MIPTESASTSGGRPLRPKALQAIAAGRVVFRESGYDAATMEAIAREAAISKATLYAHFASKEDLFEALIRHECQTINAKLYLPNLQNPSIEEELMKVAGNLRRIFGQKEGLDLYRIIVPVAPRFPRLAQVFYDEGPGASIELISRFLKGLCDAERLRIADTDLAANQLLALASGDMKLSGALALPGRSARHNDALLRSGIAMFLGFYTR